MLTTAKYYKFLTSEPVFANQMIIELLPGLHHFRIGVPEFCGEFGPDENSGVFENVPTHKPEVAGLPVRLLLVELLGVLEHRQGQVPGRGRVAGLLPEPFEHGEPVETEPRKLRLRGQHSF